MKKLTTISSIFALMAVPAIAAPTHTSATFPQNGVMEEDYQYTGQANVTNLKVASGTANTLAGYTDCPSGYPNSDAGATSTDECYKACTVADLPANSHAATASGKNYSGANVTDTCAIESCDTGYTLNPGNPNLTEIIGITEGGTANGYIKHDGTYTNVNGSTTQQTYGISAADTFGIDYGSGKGRITGKALCSTQVGYTDTVNNNNSSYNNPTTFTTMTPEFGTQGAEYCYCTIDSYTSPEGATQSVSAPWVFSTNPSSASMCATVCASGCANYLYYATGNALPFRAAVFNAITPSAPSCDANVITINWDHADSADITANDAGSVTYGGNINTPKKAQHINGKIFTGWTFVTPNQ